MGATALQTVYQTFNPDLPVSFHLPTLTTETAANTILTLYVIQKDRHCMPTSDYYFTNIQPDPIIIPQHHNKWQLKTNSTANRYIEVYPSMLAEKQVPVLDLTKSTITSAADLQTAFHTLNLCPTKKEDPSHGRKQSSTEEDTH